MSDEFDTLNGGSRPDSAWTSTNVAEALPGVLTPLGWSIWMPAIETATRGTFQFIGALSKSETAIPARQEDRTVGIFYGRPALQVNLLCDWVDRMPGVDGTGLAEQALSFIPPGYRPHPQPRYYPRAAIRTPMPLLRGPGMARADRAEADRYWKTTIPALRDCDAAYALRVWNEAQPRFARSLTVQTILIIGAIQPVFDMMTTLADSVGVSAQELMAGYGGHEETAVIADLWAWSRGEIDETEFLARHGYHGPREGEISATVWREDPAPLRALLDGYRAKEESADPHTQEKVLGRRRIALERELLAKLPVWKRPVARLVLRLAARAMPMRGVCKVSFLQYLDISRAAGRRMGAILAEGGHIDDPEDVFFLTDVEMARPDGLNLRERVAARKILRAGYEGMELPTAWVGLPEPVIASTQTDDVHAKTGDVIEGTAASPGVVEGVVCVVTDPAECEVEEGEILVARDTDPSWTSLMFLSSALIADVGGLISHTAIVARELGIPCVVNTGSASKRLRTGDRVRVDGGAGTVEVLERA